MVKGFLLRNDLQLILKVNSKANKYRRISFDFMYLKMIRLCFEGVVRNDVCQKQSRPL